MKTSALVLATLALAYPGFVMAEDWPEFRGPTGQGIYQGKPLPTEWGVNKNMTWKQEFPGKAWSSPAIVKGRIYLTNAVPVAGSNNDLSLRAFSLEAETGKVIWDQEIFLQDGATAPRVHGKNSHASPTPLVDGKQVFVHFGHQGTACLDLDGKVIWKNREIKYTPVHGNGGCPVLVDDMLIFSCDGGDQQFVVGLDRQTGKQRWRTERKLNFPKGFSFSTPLVITVKGRKQVVIPASGGVAAYDPATGTEIWRVRYQGYSVVPRPVFGHGLIFLSTGYDSPSLLAIRPDGEGDVTSTHIAWTLKKNVSHNPSFVLSGDDLFMVSDNGFASCVDAKTGTVHYQERIGGAYSSSPILAEGKVYYLSEDGQGVVVKASQKFELVSRNPLNERSLASYAAVDGALYLRTEKHLYRFDAK